MSGALLSHDQIIAGALFDGLQQEGTDSLQVSFRGQVLRIYEFVRAHGFTRTLEVGFGVGGSAAHVIAATGKTHVAMDPFQTGAYKGLGLQNLQNLGMASLIEFYPEFSDVVLPRLAAQGRTFDFAYIDGDHKFDFALADFFFTDMLLEQGGFALLDDAWMPSVSRVADYIETNRANYESCEPPYPESRLYRKTSAARPNELSFRIF